MRIDVKNGKSTIKLFEAEKKTLANALNIANALVAHGGGDVVDLAQKAGASITLLIHAVETK